MFIFVTEEPMFTGVRIQSTYRNARLFDGDLIRIIVDRQKLVGSVDLIGDAQREFGAEEGSRILAARPPREDLAADPALPADTRLWAALQSVGGGTWGGCVYDVDAIVEALKNSVMPN